MERAKYTVMMAWLLRSPVWKGSGAGDASHERLLELVPPRCFALRRVLKTCEDSDCGWRKQSEGGMRSRSRGVVRERRDRRGE